MKLVMLGTGNAHAIDYYNTCFFMEEGDFSMLVDCGGGNQILKKLRDHEIPLQKLHAIFITHAHTDHILGAVWLIRDIGQKMNPGKYEGNLTIYCNKKVEKTLRILCKETIHQKVLDLLDKRILFQVVEDGQTVEIQGKDVTFFDIQSEKALQFGFSLKTTFGQRLTCLGDEPYHDCELAYVKDCDILLHEAFCLYRDKEIFDPYRKSHSTVKDACETAQALQVKNLILYHTEEATIGERASLYRAEGTPFFSGNLWIPEDDEVLEFAASGALEEDSHVAKKGSAAAQTMQELVKQFAFLEEIDQEKMIGRQTYLTGGKRKENDAEHAWHLAMMTILLGEYANVPIDILKTVTMVLLHDLVEIDAGDTYAYDEKGKTTQREREVAAADRIFGMLPEHQQQNMRSIWEEFEARQTPEAKFARTMDNIQPMMLNAATDGKAWTEHQVKLSQILKRNERTAEGSELLWEYARTHFLYPHVAAGHIIEDEKCAL